MNGLDTRYQYKKTSIETASPERLLLMLYNGAINFIHQAVQALSEQDYERSHYMLVKAQDIIRELTVTLNMDYEISGHLMALYEYFLRRLIDGNVQKAPEPLLEVAGLMGQLRDGWEEASRSLQAASSQPMQSLNIQG